MKEQTCENCYNHVCPTVGVIFPMYRCLADDSAYGGETTEQYQKADGLNCPHWHPKAKVMRFGAGRRH